MVRTGGVVAIVPARGGSKSIPRKNVRPLAGVPLLAYSIAAGLDARSVDRVIVSTDDDEIAAIARRYGADVPFVRPSSLAADTTPDLPVFVHALGWLYEHDAWLPEVVVQLRPTSPLRPPHLVDEAVDLLRSDLRASSVRGVVPAAQNPYKMWHLEPDGAMRPLVEHHGPEPYNQPRQTLPCAYWQTGHVDAIRTATIREQASMTGPHITGLVIDSAYSCDLDTETDWLRLEWTMAHLHRPFVRPSASDSGLPDEVRLIVFDFDGVMTDNRVWVTGTGEEWVACDRSDGLGLDRLRRVGVPLLVISTERDPVVGARCRKLGLEFEQGVGDKGARLREVLTRCGIHPRHVVYVGNDLNDLDCMKLVGCAVAVADAHPDVLACASIVLTRPGGRGAVRELCDRLQAQLARRTAVPIGGD